MPHRIHPCCILPQLTAEGSPNDYKMAHKYATDFKFSRFDLETAAPRDVAKLVAKGELNAPSSFVIKYNNSEVGALSDVPEEDKEDDREL